MPPDTRPQPINLLKYHRPKIRFNQARIPALSQQSKQCLRNLVSHRSPKSKLKFPRSRCAAVLVALFVGRMGDLYVLLSRRSATLRSYAGDTSLPGGKVDPEDRTFEDTARREAYEEIGLPRDRQKVPLLCVLEPFLASNQLIVTPVVVLILDNTLRPILNAAEVTSIFSHPLASFLSSTPPFPAESESLEVTYHSYTDIPWSGSAGYRPGSGIVPTSFQSWTSSLSMDGSGEEGKQQSTLQMIRVHRFLTGREAGGIKPVFGLTASILIHAATIGYGHAPLFDVDPPSGRTPPMEARIAYAMLSKPEFREACEREEGVGPLDLGLLWGMVEKGRATGLESESGGKVRGEGRRGSKRERSKL